MIITDDCLIGRWARFKGSEAQLVKCKREIFGVQSYLVILPCQREVFGRFTGGEFLFCVLVRLQRQMKLKCSLERQLCLSEEGSWQVCQENLKSSELPRIRDSEAVRTCASCEEARALLNLEKMI